jgi:uncharacterized membrane protein YuzA (DUF378 family)
MKTINIVAAVLVIVGAINWGLVGLFQFDLVATLLGGQSAGIARIVYSLVGVAGAFMLARIKSTAAGSAARA